MAKEKQSHGFTVTVAALIVVVLLVYMFCFTVRETEVAIRTTFGKPTQVFSEPGLYFKLPWPIHRVYTFDARVHVFEDTFEETLTRDKKNIILTVAVGWRIDPGKVIKFRESILTIDRCKLMLEPVVRDAKTKIVGQYDFRNFASVREGDLKHAEVEKGILDLVNNGTGTVVGVRESYGVDVVLVKLKRVELPQDVTNKVFERMKNERKREADKFRAEGKAISEEIKARADAARAAILAMADREARAIKGKGDAEAAESYKVLNEDPELAIFLLQIEALPKVADKLTLILDPTVPPFNLLLQAPTIVPRRMAANPKAGKE